MEEVRRVPEAASAPFPRARAWLAAGAMALLTMAGAAYDQWSARKAVEDAALRAAGRVALVAEAMTDHARLLLAAMESLMLASRADELIASQLLAWKAKQPQLLDLLVLDASGKIMQWTGPGAPPDVSDRDYYRVHLGAAGPALYFSPAQDSRVHPGKRFVAVSAAVRDGARQLRHVLVAVFDADQLARRIAPRIVAPLGEGAVFDHSGVLVFGGPTALAPPVAMRLGKRDPGFQPDPGELLWLPVDGGEWPATMRAVPRSPLLAVGTVDPAQLRMRWQERLPWWFAFWLLASALTMFLLAASFRRRGFADALAFRDPVTGLPNRATIRATASELAPDVVGKEDFAVLLLDIDAFGAFGRRHGEVEGNRRLREVAALLAREVGEHGVVGRHGDDEFLVVLPRHGAVAALALAENLRLAASNTFPDDGPLTVSIGVASANPLDPSAESVLARAAEALAAARAAGGAGVRYS